MRSTKNWLTNQDRNWIIYQKKILKYVKKTRQKNLSTVEIQEQFIDVLSKSIDYKIATENIPVHDIIAELENATQILPIINTRRQIREERRALSVENEVVEQELNKP